MSTPRFAGMSSQRRSVCPACRELIHPDAEICPKCRAGIWVRVDGEPDAAEAWARVEEMAAQAEEPGVAAPEEQTRPLYRRPAVVILLALTLASIVTAYLGWTVFGRERFWVATVGTFASIAFAAGLLYAATYKPLWKEPPTRPTGEAAVLAYFEAVLHKQWGAAHRALSPFARGRAARVPGIPGLGLAAAQESFETPQGVERYWRRITHTGPAQSNVLLGVTVTPRPPLGRIETHRVVLDLDPRVQVAGLTVVEGSRAVGLTFDCVAVKHRSQYWVLTGEVCSAIDRLLAMSLRE